MNKFIDLTGKRFGRLKVIKISYRDKRERIYWLCKCNCENEKEIRGDSLRDGYTKSCGCLQKEKITKTGLIIKHGMRKTTEYNSWNNMKARCLNKNNHKYPNYGNRGIKVCDSWLESFENFYKDMGNKPKDKSIERIDNNGNYEPKNCRWATPKEQARNTRRNFLITYKGETKCLAEWSEILKIDYKKLIYRTKYTDWSIERAFTT